MATEHILNFAISLDDEAIRKAVQEKAEKEIIANIQKEVMNKIFVGRYYGQAPTKIDRYTGKITVDSAADLSSFSEKLVIDILQEHKDEIIDKAAEKLAESYKRTKAYKDAMGEVIKK